VKHRRTDERIERDTSIPLSELSTSGKSGHSDPDIGEWNVGDLRARYDTTSTRTRNLNPNPTGTGSASRPSPSTNGNAGSASPAKFLSKRFGRLFLGHLYSSGKLCSGRWSHQQPLSQ
jgi:hypothetical protein